MKGGRRGVRDSILPLSIIMSDLHRCYVLTRIFLFIFFLWLGLSLGVQYAGNTWFDRYHSCPRQGLGQVSMLQCSRQPMPPTPWLSPPGLRRGTSGHGARPCLPNEIENLCVRSGEVTVVKVACGDLGEWL